MRSHVLVDSVVVGCVVARPIAVLRVFANGVQFYLSAFLKLVGCQADPQMPGGRSRHLC